MGVEIEKVGVVIGLAPSIELVYRFTNIYKNGMLFLNAKFII